MFSFCFVRTLRLLKENIVGDEVKKVSRLETVQFSLQEWCDAVIFKIQFIDLILEMNNIFM